MSTEPVITIIRNQIQESWIKKSQKRDHIEKIQKNLESLLSSMGEIDDRQVNGIDISSKKNNIESFLKEYFDISEDELETEDQKQRFELEVKRSLITIELEDIENRIASCNRRLKMTDPELGVFGIDDYEPASLEAYTKIILLERDLRNVIVDTLEGVEDNWWNILPKETREGAEKKFKDEMLQKNMPQNFLREIDFIDFSDYEEIFKGKIGKRVFFNGNDKAQWAIVTKLSDMRILRNKIMHRPPLDEEEFIKFQAHHADIMSFVKGIEKTNG